MPTTTLDDLRAQVRSQRTEIPALYGKVDFDLVPERFAAEPDAKTMLPPSFAQRFRPFVLRDQERVDRALAYTMLGDVVADAYAALLPKLGFRALVDMLVLACEKGIDAVKDAPPELARFVASMEHEPAWLDRRLSAEGARAARVSMAIFAPWVIRGAFIATFMNKYSGLPMALTGALSEGTSAKRVKETASFFTTASLPGALERFGSGFRAAAMVRLMHSMVRASLLLRPGKWDVKVYGIPIPQVDQMPAGTIPAFITAFRAVQEGRGFTRRERAVVELCRHQSYLLGLPEDLLPETPEGIFRAMITYAGTLRDGYDDATNGELVRGTMAAYMPLDQRPESRLSNSVERSISKVFFKHSFSVPDEKARRMGVYPDARDYAIFAGFQAVLWPRLLAHMAAERIPLVNELADARLVARIDELLVSYGHAEFTTDPAKHKAA